ncbi:hypothetical protein C9374_003345 [Naegleria lovaniensis]|uniref:Exportin-T n=1 Tax=Naegleria lovaniensis TaxID=51637 RepID=A0AA88GRH5_NAELO|nr:uncharacterized protein C9374_003345 [Naegleria lovaniensis]KAG2385530.1 hypothetical protein C9374_003345 [Naegleria lovaniensis]
MDEQFKQSFERAILSQADAFASQSVKKDAYEYCEQLKLRDDIWKICLQFVLESTHDQVKFWCFGTLSSFLAERASILSDQDKDTIKNALMHWFLNVMNNRTPAFLKNKFCETLVAIFRIEYYSRWPSFFKDLFSILSNSPSELMIEMYLNILDTIDFEFVARYIERSPESHKRAVDIKDAMREDCIPQVVSTFYTILSAKHLALSNHCLTTMSNYIDWIDINLVTTEQFVQLFYQFLTMNEFRTNTCKCLCVMVEKGMNDNDKLKLITSLQIPQILLNTVVDSNNDEQFAESVSELAAGVSNQLLEISSRPNQDYQLQSSASKILQDIFPFVLALFADADDQVSSSVIKFLNDFVSVIKKSKTLQFETLQTQLHEMLTTIQKKAKFTEDFKFDPSQQDDYETGFLEYRRELFVLYKNIGIIAPDLMKHFIHALTNHTIGNLNVLGFADAEICLTLLYITAEVFPDMINRPNINQQENIFFNLLLQIVGSNISSFPHSSIQLAYFEVLSRYASLVPKFPDDVISSMLQSFVDERGLRNTNPQVQGRAKFLFSKFSKPLRERLSGFIEPLFVSLKEIMSISLPSDQDLSVEDYGGDRFFLYEAIGYLCASEKVTSEIRQKVFQEILIPFNSAIEEILNQKLFMTDTAERPRFTKYISSMIRASAFLSKGFDDSAAKKVYFKDSVEFFKHFLMTVTRVHSEVPKSKDIQTCVILYYHRMIELMNEEILEVIPSTLSNLYQSCTEIYQMKDLLILLGQVMQKYKDKVFNLVNEMFGPLVTKIYPMMNNGVYDYSLISTSEETREKSELHKSYFVFLHTIFLTGLQQVLVSDKNRALFNGVLETVLKGCQHASVYHIKTALLCLENIVNCYSPQLGAEFNDFVMKNITVETFTMLFRPDFDINDGASFNVVSNVTQVFAALVDKCGPAFLNYLANSFLPQLGMDNNDIQGFCLTLQDINNKKNNGLERFKQLFVTFLQARKKK